MHAGVAEADCAVIAPAFFRIRVVVDSFWRHYELRNTRPTHAAPKRDRICTRTIRADPIPAPAIAADNGFAAKAARRIAADSRA